jgi:uncharacterized protein YabE (DUF348 family)
MSTRHSKLKRLTLFLMGAATVFAAAAVYLLLTSSPTYTIRDGDKTVPIAGQFETVGELLAAADIEVRPEDNVEPAVVELSHPEVTVKIERSSPVTVRTTQATSTIWTLEQSLAGFLQEIGAELKQTDPVFADGALIPHFALGNTPLPKIVEIGRFHTVSILDGRQRQLVRTPAPTVAAALHEVGIVLETGDTVDPGIHESLSNEMVITIERAFSVAIQADGDTILYRGLQTRASDVLAEAGIVVSELDYTIPGDDVILGPDDFVRLVRVTEDFRTEDVFVPFQVIWQATDTLPLDSQALVSSGTDGILRRRLRVRYEDGKEVESTLDGEWVAREPVNEVIGYGTRIELNSVNTEEGPRDYWRVVRMRVTSYTAASSGKQPSDPDYGQTASGVRAGFGVVAIDRNIVPFRSHVYVPGYGIGFAGDTGGGVRGRWIDLGYDEDQFVSWSGYVEVYFLTPVPPAEDINFLLPAAPP